MQRINKFLAALVAAMLMSGAALALDGFSIGVIGINADFETSGSEIEGANPSAAGTADKETNSGTHSKNVTYGSVFADYTHVWGQFGLTIGVEAIPGETEIGAKSRTDATTDGNETNQDDGTYTAKADISDHQSLYIEPTLMVNENFGVYVKGGISEVTVNTLESLSVGADDSAYGNETVYGVATGVGIKGTHANGLGFKLEYLETNYEHVEMTSTTGNKNRITADVDQQATRLAIFYNF